MYRTPVDVPLIVFELPMNELRPPVEVKVLVMVMFPVAADAFVLPAESLNDSAGTVTVPVPPAVR
jgi:hypothetical protein